MEQKSVVAFNDHENYRCGKYNSVNSVEESLDNIQGWINDLKYSLGTTRDIFIDRIVVLFY